jgi:hypothetical protein
LLDGICGFRIRTADKKRNEEESDMKKRSTCLLFLATVAAGFLAPRVRATPANSGYTSTTLALGRFGPIDVLVQQMIAANVWRGSSAVSTAWISMQRTTADSDLYVQNNTWQPASDTGWHSHPGHSLIIVTAGTVTDYESDDPDCKPTQYTQGMGFVDSGGDHVHIIRNEGSVVATTVAVQLIPANAARRIDEPEPSNCHL